MGCPPPPPPHTHLNNVTEKQAWFPNILPLIFTFHWSKKTCQFDFDSIYLYYLLVYIFRQIATVKAKATTCILVTKQEAITAQGDLGVMIHIVKFHPWSGFKPVNIETMKVHNILHVVFRCYKEFVYVKVLEQPRFSNVEIVQLSINHTPSTCIYY